MTVWRPRVRAVARWVLMAGALIAWGTPAWADPLQAVRDALHSGNAAAAAARAEAFINASPGDARLPDAQLLLARARELAGAWGAAWDQYSLFLRNFPEHPKRDEAASRAEALIRDRTQRPDQPPSRWRIAPGPEGAEPAPGEALVIRVDAAPLSFLGRRVTRSAIDGVRVWVWHRLEIAGSAFDPFDEDQVAELERQFTTMAAWPIEGFLVDDALHLGSQARPPGAAAAYERLAAAVADAGAGRERLTWTWAGMRARASASALSRWVAAVEAINPEIGWLVRVSGDAVLRPERALRDAGHDLAELRLAAPAVAWAFDAPTDIGARLSLRLAELGWPARIVLWPAGGEPAALGEESARDPVGRAR